jgi:hypothetical protein
MLMNLAASAELYHTATGTAFADLVIGRHRETWPVRIRQPRRWRLIRLWMWMLN